MLSAEDYSGLSPNTAPLPGPSFLSTYTDALADAGIPADVYDIDAANRTQADLLGVLSHYKAVVWYTGTDDYVRDPGQTTGVTKMYDDQMNSIRDYLNEGGKVLVAGQRALQGAWSEYSYNPLGRLPALAAVHVQHGRAGDGPARELRERLQRLPAVLDGRVRARQPGHDRGRRGRADDRRPGPFTDAFKLTGQSFLGRLHADVGAAVGDGLPAVRRRQGDASSSRARRTWSASRPTGTLLWGFGLENIADRAARAKLIGQGLKSLGVDPYTQRRAAAGPAPCRRRSR